MNTYESVAVVTGLVGAGFIGYLLGVAIVHGSPPPPPPPPAPIPGETWRMKRREYDSPWKELPEVTVLRTLNGWVEFRQNTKLLCTSLAGRLLLSKGIGACERSNAFMTFNLAVHGRSRGLHSHPNGTALCSIQIQFSPLLLSKHKATTQNLASKNGSGAPSSSPSVVGLVSSTAAA